MVFLLPENVQQSAKDFVRRGSNKYDSFTASEDPSGKLIHSKEK
jgi:hypothetical protein